ncbi:PP2C family protein-serine/threonine phosphatase [Catenulispora rubra]|uniref:PP2C family protein-serine/threonine phosphatase n=1 Tax=Catenulispora rubra TaxID=280293 RepID=UPI0018924CB9|nr:protein phosphatase 2C domain-containing protein [Catenulispora rubra]
MLAILAGTASEAGRRHGSNEDRVLAGRSIFAVADGMGGHAAGEVASALAIARLGLLDGEPVLTPDGFRAQLAEANADILASAFREPDQRGMGATVAGIGIARVAGTEHWVVFNIGDCRVYRWAKGRLTQLTLDHNEAAEVSEAAASPDAAVGVGRRSLVTRSLGSEPASEPDIRVLPPVPGERFLICSDGLYLELADSAIAEMLETEPDSSAAARALVRAAIAAGGRDDISAVVVDHRTVAAGTAGEETQPRQAGTEALR